MITCKSKQNAKIFIFIIMIYQLVLKNNTNFFTDIAKNVPGFIDPIKLQLMYQDAIQHIENDVQIENDKGIFDSSAALDYDFLKSEVFKKSFQTGFVNQKASKIINKYDTIHLNSKEGK